MPEKWYPGAIRNPGAAAGYKLTYDHHDGRTFMRGGKAHYTAGYDSTGRGLEGYFQFLVGRDGEVQQFAEADAYCMDSGEANGMGPGIEIEYRDEDTIFTAEARVACAGIMKWLRDEWGIELTYHDGGPDNHDTLPLDISGWCAHRAIIQSDPHSDYWPEADVLAMFHIITPPEPPTPLERAPMYVAYLDNRTRAFQVQDNYPVEIPVAAADDLVNGATGCPSTSKLSSEAINAMAKRYEQLHPTAAAIAAAIKP